MSALRNIIIVGLAMGIFSGCDAVDNVDAMKLAQLDAQPGHGSGVGKMKLLATRDSSAATEGYSKASASGFSDVASATITFDGMDLRNVQGETFNYQVQPFVLDFIDLSPNLGLALSRIKAPAGQYDQLRLHTVGTGTLTYRDGSTATFDIPSGTTSGLKVFFDQPLQIIEDALVIAVINVDVSNSFVFTGQGKVHFRPVLRVEVSAPIELPPPPVVEPAPIETPAAVGDPVSGETPAPTPTETPVPTDPSLEAPVDLSGGTTDGSSAVTPPDQNDPNYYGWLIGV